MQFSIKQLEGKEHYVVPVVMLTVGVANGSKGAIFYPSGELRQSVPLWNGRPVVVYHPKMLGGGDAGNPSVFNRQRIGWVFNTKFDGKRLTAEAWIDPERCQRVDKRVLDAIRQNKHMEVSTGLYTDDEEKEGTFNGKDFEIIGRNYKPDHLALLPDLKGACSRADGCGLCRNFEVLIPVNNVAPTYRCY